MYRLIGKMVADGGDVPGRTNIPAGTVLYKVSMRGGNSKDYKQLGQGYM